MVYELAVVARFDLDEKGVQNLVALVTDVVKEKKGEIVLQDDWGTRTFAQPTVSGIKKGRYIYIIFRTESDANAEINRRLRIHEDVVRHLIVRLGQDRYLDRFVKNYKTPFSKKYHGSAMDVEDDFGTDLGETDRGGDRKKFSRRRGCWYTANKCTADWKDPPSFAWLLNEFGKISPSRISGITRIHQQNANRAIKRARQLCLASSISNRIAD